MSTGLEPATGGPWVASESSDQVAESQQDEQQRQGDQQNQQVDEQSQRQDLQSYSYDDIKDNAPVRKNDPRTSVQKTEEYRFANNIPADQTIPEKAYADYVLEYDDEDAVM